MTKTLGEGPYSSYRHYLQPVSWIARAQVLSALEGSKGFEAFMAVARRLADVSDKFFFWKSVEDLKDTMNLKANMNLGTLSDVLSLRMHRTVAGQIKRNIADPRVRQMLDEGLLLAAACRIVTLEDRLAAAHRHILELGGVITDGDDASQPTKTARREPAA